MIRVPALKREVFELFEGDYFDMMNNHECAVVSVQVTRPWTMPLMSADYNGYWEASNLKA